jgi:hypothetical protein
MGLILCFLAFAGVAILIRRSLGDGLGLLLAIGSVYGIARCNIFDGFTHFLFDASVLGAYVGGWRYISSAESTAAGRLRHWVLALAFLPFFLILLSPFIEAQPVLVQLLGLRPAIFFVPLVFFGAALDRESLRTLAHWAVFVALLAGGTALAEYFLGVERFFPMNEASDIIYLSQDIGEARDFRIPATFSSAHAYGATMVGILPLLMFLLEEEGRWRLPALAATVTAVIGVFACGARSTVIALGILTIGFAARGLKSGAVRTALIVVSVAVLAIVPRVSRFQRFETLADYSYTTTRVESSVNASFLDTIIASPLGRGLGSAVGTSIPFFLAAQARPQIGLENEYARIAVEEGVLGLCLWIAFALFGMVQNPLELKRFGGGPDLCMWLVCAFAWIGGFVGTGLLASVPGTMLLMIYMGVLVVGREAFDDANARLPLSPTGLLRP